MKKFASLIRPVSRASTVLAGMLLTGVMLQAPVGGAQVTTSITSSGLGTTVTPAGTTHNITGGTRPGNGTNLFHSFGLFNVGEGNSANFLNNTGLPTSNILGRVTGGQISSIFGTIQTTNFGAANLFLINPNGWIFGPTASLNVGGSFHVSTADYIRLSDGVQFNANGLNDALLTSAPPAAFGFLGSPLCVSPCISVDGGFLGGFLQVPEGQTLSLVGGDVQIMGAATLSAPSGRVQIGSFTSKGEATVDGLNGSFASLGRVEILDGSSISAVGGVSVDADGNSVASNGGTVLIRGGQVDILGGASVNASGAQIFDPDFNPLGGSAGGTVVIRGGRLLVDSSTVAADTFGDVNGSPVGIDIQMADSVELTTGTSIATATSGKGRGGDIRVTANQVSVDGSFVSTSTFGDGRAGDISVENVARLSLTGFAEISSLNLSFGSNVSSAGNVTVRASELVDISGGGKLSNTSFFNGNGGELTISAPSLRLAGEGTGIVTSTTDSVGTGIPGNVAIDVGELIIADGAQLGSFASTFEGGRGGNLTVHAGSALISGTDAGGFASGIYSSNSVGAAGDISLNAARLTLTAGAVIESGNPTDPRGGNVTISANESIVISEGSGVTLRAFSQDVGQLSISAPTGSLTIDNGFVSTSTTEAGRAGDISVNVRELALTRGGQITSSSEAFASGGGGNVTISSDSASISGSSPSGMSSNPFSTDPRSGVFSTTAGTGPGGTIAMSAPTLTMNDNGAISAATSGSGSAGNISLNVGNFTQIGGARVDSSTTSEGQGGNLTVTATESMSISGSGSLPSGLFSTASSTGNAGQITVSAPTLAPVPTLTMADGGKISVETLGAGSAGSILLNANTLNLTGGAQVVSSTSGAGQGGNLTLTATESASFSGLGSGLFSTAAATGAAGQITVSTQALTMADGGTISVATEGAGAAGNISLSVNNLSLAGGAQVVSSTTGDGAGGTLALTAGEFVSISGTGSGLFSTASSTGNAGQITVSAPTLAPVPTLTMADGGKISVATSGAGSAGGILLNANTLNLTGGAQVVSSTSDVGNAGSISLNVSNFTQADGSRVESSTSGAGAGGTLGLTASELVSISGTGSGLFSTASSSGNAGQIMVTAPGSTPVPTLMMADNGKISVETSNTSVGAGSAGSILLNASTLSLTGGAQVVSSTSGGGQGGSVTATATESISISGSGSLPSGLFSTASNTGNAGQISVSTPTLTMGESGTISVATEGSGSAGNITLNVSNFTQTGGAQVVSSTTGEGAGGTLALTAGELVSISGAGSGLFSTASSTGNAGQVTVSAPALAPVPTLTMADGGKISVATSGAGSAGSILLNANTLNLTGGAQVVSSTTGDGAGGTLGLTASELVSISGTGSGLFSTASSTGNAGQITVAAPGSTPVSTLTMTDGGKISVATSGAGSAGSILLNANTFSLTGGAQVVSSTSGAGAGGTLGLTAGELVSISGAGSGLFSTAASGGNAGQITVSAPALAPVPTLTLDDGGKISVETSGAGSAGSILLNANTLNLTGGAQVVSSTTSAGQGGNLTLTATESASFSGLGSGLFSTAAATGAAGQITVSTQALTMADGGTISVATEGAGAAGNISLSVNNLSLAGGAQVVSSTTGDGAGGTLALTAGELVSISGAGSGLFSTASSTGNAGQITVSAPALAPVPTLTMADGGRVSVATEGSGGAGNIALNVSNFTQTGGAQVVSSTTGDGAGGTLALTAGELVSISGAGSGLFSTAASSGNAGQITVSAPALAPVPTLTMADGGRVSVATEGSGSAGNISLNVSNFTQTGRAQVVSSTTGDGAGGTLALTAGEMVSISGAGSGLFSTASSTGNAGQITVSAPALAPVPTLTMADGGTISVATSGAGSAGSILLNANTLNLTGGAQVVSSTTGAGGGGNLAVTATNSISISGSGSLPSGLFSTASNTGGAGEVTVSTPTLAMSDGGTISVATSGAGNAGNALLNVSNFSLTGGAQIVSSTSGAGQGGTVLANATDSASISGPGTGVLSNASGTGPGGTISIQAAQLQITDAAAISANSTGTATATAGNVNIVAGELVQMQNGSITTASTQADGGNISIITTGSMVRLNDSQITTSVGSGAGSGGNITIGSDFVLLNNTEIRADAFGGPGGNITIVADTFLRSNGIVSASSALSTPGTIAIEATFTDVTGSFAQLPSTPLEATELLRASCAARLAGGKASSLVVRGRDGVPLQPGSLLPSPLYVSDPSIAPKSITQEMPLRFTLLGSKDRLSNQYSLLPNAKCSL